MKCRTGFVSNSSSSSFIVYLPNKPENIKEFAKFMGDCGSSDISSKEVIEFLWDKVEWDDDLNIKEEDEPFIDLTPIEDIILSSYEEGLDWVTRTPVSTWLGFSKDNLKEPLKENEVLIEPWDTSKWGTGCDNVLRDSYYGYCKEYGIHPGYPWNDPEYNKWTEKKKEEAHKFVKEYQTIILPGLMEKYDRPDSFVFYVSIYDQGDIEFPVYCCDPFRNLYHIKTQRY